jgi:hypothetical protein
MKRQLPLSRILYGPLLLVLMALVCACSPKAKAPAPVVAEVPAASTSDASTVTTPQVVAANTPDAAQPGAGASAAGPASSSADGSAAVPATRNLAGTVAVADGAAYQYGPDRVAHKISVGDKIYEGDAIITQADAEVHLNMADGGYMAVRPNTTLRITLYQANGDSTDRSVVGLLKGSFRSITGWIGKSYPANYAINTPTATIGVRGTDHEPAYVPEAVAGQEAGTYDNVYAGGTTISNGAGKIDVTPDHAGFVDPRKTSAPRVLASVPAFYKTPHRNDKLLVGKHDQVIANLEHLRTARVAQHAEEVRTGTATHGGPTSLRDRMIQNHAEASLAAHRAEANGARPAPLGRNATTEEGARDAEANRRANPMERKPLGAPADHAGQAPPKPGLGAEIGARIEAAKEAAKRGIEDAKAKAAAARSEPPKKREEQKRP